MDGYIHINGAVMVSDPCYQPGTWCQGTIKNMLPGNYRAGGEILDCGSWGKRVSRIWIQHENYDILPMCPTYEDFEVGVDSGQAGIYDLDYYLHLWKNGVENEEWYSAVCDLTYDEKHGFQYNTKDNKCFVSSAGYGDGGYTCKTAKNEDDMVIYVEIDFGIEDDEEDDDYDYDDYDYDEEEF